MAVLFISHASRDDAHASALESWLNANGFNDIFIDHFSIAGGDKWREALRASVGSCRVVVCLVTPNWLASHECYSEFGAAWYMGKRITPLYLLPPTLQLDEEAQKRLAKVRAEDQGVSIARCVGANGVLNLEVDADAASRLKSGLRAAGANIRVGLDPEAFDVDQKLRPTPFPGLSSFGDDDADAALFYGRSRELAHALEELRAMRAVRDLRPLVIMGASGAGKSSLLKAGIIPRLRREAPAWLPLRAFRPGADPLLNFAEALSRTLADFGKREAHGQIRDRLLQVWSKAERDKGELTVAGLAALENTLDAEGKKLRDAADRPTASVLISVDQAEEMARAEGDSGEALADYLRVALSATNSPWQLAFTTRTDSFPELQRHRRFQNLEARGYDLRAIPVFHFVSVVEDPAKRYGVQVDPELIHALMEDAPKEDALPLLAFALQRLWRQYAVSGSLTKDNYDKVGGLKGLIEDAAERALRGLEPEQDVPLPQKEPPKRLLDLGRATFVPAMVQINEQGATIRRVPAWKAFSEDSQDLLEHFDRWRLVVRKGKEEADGGTVEVAHEALFREWGRLKEWLEPERARLEALRALQVDAAAWKRKGKDRAFLNHREERLAEAEVLAADAGFAGQMGDDERNYLAACRTAERRRRTQARRGVALVSVLVALLGLAGVGWWQETWIRERYYRHMTMGLSVLTAEREQELAAKPGSDFKECANGCPAMIMVPPGKFMMGSPQTEKGRYNNESPQHEVTIAKAFAVSKFSVTFAEYDACVDAGACLKPKPSDGGWGRDDRPAINVRWEDGKQYAAWLSRSTGKPYRLLSEAEWEYAARAGSLTAYPWGDEIGKGNANCAKCGSMWGLKQTAPSGSFKSNAFGLYDMHGNVWQWVQDCYVDTYKNAPTNGSATPEESGCRRVIRGGSWEIDPLLLRSAVRVESAFDDGFKGLGFRLARTLNP